MEGTTRRRTKRIRIGIKERKKTYFEVLATFHLQVSRLTTWYIVLGEYTIDGDKASRRTSIFSQFVSVSAGYESFKFESTQLLSLYFAT